MTVMDSASESTETGWLAADGPRISLGGLQRATALPPFSARQSLSCPLPRISAGCAAEEPPPLSDGLDCVCHGLFISSGAVAARLPALLQAGVTHVVNAAPCVELCWHDASLVRSHAAAHRARSRRRRRRRGHRTPR